jgi:hypothetical protein
MIILKIDFPVRSLSDLMFVFLLHTSRLKNIDEELAPREKRGGCLSRNLCLRRPIMINYLFAISQEIRTNLRRKFRSEDSPQKAASVVRR